MGLLKLAFLLPLALLECDTTTNQAFLNCILAFAPDISALSHACIDPQRVLSLRRVKNDSTGEFLPIESDDELVSLVSLSALIQTV